MKRIQLGGHRRGSPIRGYALVDDEDYEKLGQYKWSMASNGAYAVIHHFLCPDGEKRSLLMHRLVMRAKPNERLDHIDGDRFNNQKKNLRLATQSENSQNRKISIRNTSGYKGVYWHKQDKRWRAYLSTGGKSYYLGGFLTKEEAAEAYNQGAKKHFKEFARPNIIKPTEK